MGRIAECLAQLDEVTVFDFSIDLKKVFLNTTKDTKELRKDMERAQRNELRQNGTELNGYKGSSIVYTASGYCDAGKFYVQSYFSKELLVLTKA